MSVPVTVSAGTCRAEASAGLLMPHAWTDDGVIVAAGPDGVTGADVLHLSVALCVLNDTFREAAALAIPVSGVRVSADGAFDTETSESTGITYAVEVDSSASTDEVATLIDRVDEVAEIPRALRAGMTVERTDG